MLFCRCLFTNLAYLCFSTLQPNPAMPPENQEGQGNRNSHCPVMAQPTMIPLSSPASLEAPVDPEPDGNLLQHPGHQELHPLWRKLKLMVCPVPGIPLKNTISLEIQISGRNPHGIRAIGYPKTVHDLH